MPPKNKITSTAPWTACYDFASLYPSMMPNFNDPKYRQILRKAKLKKIQEFQNDSTQNN